MELRRALGDVVGEAEDRRVWAGALAASGNGAEAETTLRDVAAIAEERGRPLLVANAHRDLAQLLAAEGRTADAIDLAKRAIGMFERLGAEAEAAKLRKLTAGLPRSSAT
jgi:tetratricopeptide (TPR) repeat protein